MVYRYEICAKKFLWKCLKTQMVDEIFDLTDPVQRRKLIDIGFTATSERRWQ